jgi:hypothetical protein
MNKLALDVDTISVQSFAVGHAARVPEAAAQAAEPSWRPSQCITSCTRDDER